MRARKAGAGGGPGAAIPLHAAPPDRPALPFRGGREGDAQGTGELDVARVQLPLNYIAGLARHAAPWFNDADADFGGWWGLPPPRSPHGLTQPWSGNLGFSKQFDQFYAPPGGSSAFVAALFLIKMTSF